MKFSTQTIIAICMLAFSQMNAQEFDKEKGHFLVTFEAFSPPIQAIVKSFEGYPAKPFLANDINGKEHYLDNYKGKTVLLWFWSIESPKAVEQIDAITLFQQRHEDVKVVSFAKEPKAKVAAFAQSRPVGFDIIPNGEVFGQMAYGADMGSPRMFFIDEFGVIKVAIPEQAFQDNSKLITSLENILKSVQQ